MCKTKKMPCKALKKIHRLRKRHLFAKEDLSDVFTRQISYNEILKHVFPA